MDIWDPVLLGSDALRFWLELASEYLPTGEQLGGTSSPMPHFLRLSPWNDYLSAFLECTCWGRASFPGATWLEKTLTQRGEVERGVRGRKFGGWGRCRHAACRKLLETTASDSDKPMGYGTRKQQCPPHLEKSYASLSLSSFLKQAGDIYRFLEGPTEARIMFGRCLATRDTAGTNKRYCRPLEGQPCCNKYPKTALHSGNMEKVVIQGSQPEKSGWSPMTILLVPLPSLMAV